ncbi:MAG: nucleoside-diphosphate sugar epimerase [Acidobacteria bacterium]|nr:MAG: nucleoside-diphosphate sugar epimerase [Acidobacteriota bacterium]
MRFLITGGAGFIGSHLAQRLVRRGYRVSVLDNLSTGRLGNLEPLVDARLVDFNWGSIQDRYTVEKLVGEADFVVHLAASLGVKLILEHPVESIETNVTGTQIVLEAAARNRTPVLIASTSEVYGKSNKVPFCEDDDLVLGSTRKSRWSYAASKILDECLALSYWEEKQLPTIVVRFFNTVGPRQNARYGMVLPTFVQQALAEVPITIHGDGKQSRCFCDVRDAVEAVTKLIDARAFGEIFNIGGTQEISIEDLAMLVRQRVGSRSQILYTPYDQAYGRGYEDMQRRVPSVEKLDGVTGFRPKIALQEIIDRTAAHLRSTMIEVV